MKPSDYIAKGWCQGWHAQSTMFHKCNPLSPYALRWSVLGAVFAALGIGTVECNWAIERLRAKVGKLYEYNDSPGRTQIEILALLKSLDL